MNQQRKTKAAYTSPIFTLGMPLHSVTVTLLLTNGGTTAIKHILSITRAMLHSSYEEVLDRTPDCIAAHYGRCKMLRALSRRREALLAYDELLQLDPTSARAHVGKAWVLVDLRRYEEALAAFEHALQLDPALGKAVSGKRYVLERLHRDKEAEGLVDPETTRTARQRLAAQECTTAEDYYA